MKKKNWKIVSKLKEIKKEDKSVDRKNRKKEEEHKTMICKVQDKKEES